MKTMLDYINEEQAALIQILNQFQLTDTDVSKVTHCLILATGSSHNACQAAKVYLEEVAPIYVEIQEPFNFAHYGKVDDRFDLVVAVSQSGKSTSTIDAIAKIKNQTSVKTVALTSDVTSPITEVVDEVLDLKMGLETVGFVTKGYTATLLNLFLFGLKLGYQKHQLTKVEVEEELAKLAKAIQEIDSVIYKTEQFWQKTKKELTEGTRFIAIGYGPNIGTAKEFETKFTETVRLPSQGFEVEAYMHGPYLEADTTHLLFFIENQSPIQARSQALKNYLASYVGQCYTITTGSTRASNTLDLASDVEEKISPLLLVIPFQYLAYQVATSKGIDLSQRIFDDFDCVLKSKIAKKEGNQSC